MAALLEVAAAFVVDKLVFGRNFPDKISQSRFGDCPLLELPAEDVLEISIPSQCHSSILAE
ncbi:hypothetical protein OSK93_24040, partial [Escherichia coli]|nr:hypothetical protein [Escherichia coli]